MKNVMLAAVAVAVLCGAAFAVNPATTDEAAPRKNRRQFAKAQDRRPDIRRLFRLALLAARAREDAELQGLVDKAITDRKVMINAESARLDAFENLVKAIRAEDKEQIKTKKAALQEATQALRATVEQLAKDIAAIRKRLHELHPELKEEENAQRFRRRNFNQPMPKEDVPPQIN